MRQSGSNNLYIHLPVIYCIMLYHIALVITGWNIAHVYSTSVVLFIQLPCGTLLIFKIVVIREYYILSLLVYASLFSV